MEKKTFQAKNHIKISNFAESNMHRKTNARASFKTDFYFLVLSLGKCVAENHTEKLQLLLRSLLLKKILHLNNFAA